MSTLSTRTFSGISWSLLSQISRQLLTFIIGVILARLLSPREFGLVAMITIFTGFATLFSELGLGAALIQKPQPDQSHKSSVFWLNIIAGTALTSSLLLFAPVIASFYGEPLLTPLTRVLAITFLIGSFSIVQSAVLSKQLDFRTLALVEVASVFLSGTVAIGLAVTGFGVWSLVWRAIAATLASTVLLWWLGKWRPSFTFSYQAIRELFWFSANLQANNSLNYWVRNADNLLIGKVLGSGSLGVYSRTYSVMLYPLHNISGVISRVMFPSLSSIQDDHKRVRRIFLRMTSTIALVTFPLMFGLFVTAELFVLTLFGEQWVEMIPVLRVFCVTGALQSIGTLKGNLFLSQGRTDLQFRLGLVAKTAMILGVIIGLNWGILGVAIGYTLASAAMSYPEYYFSGRLVGLRFAEIVRPLWGITLCSLSMAVLVHLIGIVLLDAMSAPITLTIQMIAGAFSYLSFLYLFKIEAYQDACRLLNEQLSLYRHRSTAESSPTLSS